MAVLIYSWQGRLHDFALPREKSVLTYLKANEDHSWMFSLNGDAREYPAQLVRADNGFYVLIARGQDDVKVNGIRVFGLRVLRNADNIQVGQEEIRFYEWVLQVLASDSPFVGARCSFCARPFVAGGRVILCPRCDTPLHDECWVSRKGVSEGCVLPNCGYVVPEEEPYVAGR